MTIRTAVGNDDGDDRSRFIDTWGARILTFMDSGADMGDKWFTFEEMQRELGIARNILTDRLKTLVANSHVEKDKFNEFPPRFRYRLVKKD